MTYYNAENYGEAAKMFKPSAEIGNADAQFKVGHIYQPGEGVPKDLGEAAKWYKMATD